MAKILIIDDEATILENLSFVLELEDFDVIQTNSGQKGIAFFRENYKDIDVVITDMNMPQKNGMDVLKAISRISPETGVIILTGNGDMQNAILSMKEGAYDYISKPVNVDKLIISLRNAIQNKKLFIQNKHLQEDLIEKNNYLQDLHDQAQKILINLLPGKLPRFDLLETDYFYQNCEKVGGDMFDVFDMEKYICFYIFDVCSHGIVASVITLILKSYFDNLKYQIKNKNYDYNFSRDIQHLNIEMLHNTSNNIFATLFIGYLKKDTLELKYISAGHIDQYCISEECITPLSSTGTILGLFEEATFPMKSKQLSLGEKILLFTDGITEACSPDGNILSQECILDYLNNNRTMTISTFISDIKDMVNRFGKGRLDDDMTILGIKIRE